METDANIISTLEHCLFPGIISLLCNTNRSMFVSITILQFTYPLKFLKPVFFRQLTCIFFLNYGDLYCKGTVTLLWIEFQGLGPIVRKE